MDEEEDDSPGDVGHSHSMESRPMKKKRSANKFYQPTELRG